MADDKQFEWGITTLGGARPEVIKHLETQFEVDPEYRKKWRRTKFVSKILDLLAFLDRIRYEGLKKRVSIDLPPIFIIGHWRSGTTLMHNMLCEITPATYCTTYQNVFPNNLFAFYGIIRRVVHLYMPRERPGDHTKMHILLPQEEELALGNTIPHCFYYWMFFPREMLALADKYLNVGENPENLKRRWKENYLRFIKRSMLRNGGEQFVSKNPPNTARIDVLLDLFPDARFIFLVRDVYDTILSTKRFFKSILPAQQFQNISDADLEKQVISLYSRLHTKYLKDKTRIPTGNLVELKFEDFILSPLHFATRTLDQLRVDYAVGEVSGKKYHRNTHKVREYAYPSDFLSRVNGELAPFFEVFGYPMHH